MIPMTAYDDPPSCPKDDGAMKVVSTDADGNPLWWQCKDVACGRWERNVAAPAFDRPQQELF